MGKLTLCDAKLIGDIPTYDVLSYSEISDLVEHWTEPKRLKTSVYVCFNSWENEHVDRILILDCIDEIQVEEMRWLEEVKIKEMDYSIFEFESWQDAVLFCKDLKEA